MSGNAETAERAGVFTLVGRTPLVRLARVEASPGVRLFAKTEWCNPGGSVKDRAAAAIIEDAEAQGRLRHGVRLLDASSGNTAVAYALLGAAKGYGVTLCVPRNANVQVLGLLHALEAEVVLTDPLTGSDGAIETARRMAWEQPDRYCYVDQYNNPANWRAHYHTTAEEIWEQTQGEVTHFVAGLGTTGTFTGTTRRLKERRPDLHAVAVQPDDALHGLEGLKHLESAIVPGIYDPTLPDETLFLSTEEAIEAAARLARTSGLVIGPSGGAALAASLRLADRLRRAGRAATIVTVFPDSGARHLPLANGAPRVPAARH